MENLRSEMYSTVELKACTTFHHSYLPVSVIPFSQSLANAAPKINGMVTRLHSSVLEKCVSSRSVIRTEMRTQVPLERASELRDIA